MRNSLRFFTCALCALGLIFLIGIPESLEAAPPDPAYAGPEKCAECHPIESVCWESSPHAQALTDVQDVLLSVCGTEAMAAGECDCLQCHTTAYDVQDGGYAHGGVTCEACHGAYLEGHPETGIVPLATDSQLCESCHESTHQQWLVSSHAAADVQCTACHQVHTQELRLDKVVLCTSCHPDQLDDGIHVAHTISEISCADCHLDVQTSVQSAEMLQVADRPVSVSHDFGVDTGSGCVQCHLDDVASHEVVDTQVINDQFSRVVLELDDARETIRSLKTISVVALGAGLGVGGLGGAVMLLMVGWVLQRGSKQ